ncbi:uncharacterized protein C8A04DRAFT_35169 [Dichotomopilus funicola]|uniref:DUF7924 domain-containing protein n=1 Tax=Dichotomopilus funicola TaxID=1934379 RepID=A0AAN6ZPK8_9PEZI|nr:hypothetical protein C8A04DRAFT_35169 [Dichotomopilus funicola]
MNWGFTEERTRRSLAAPSKVVQAKLPGAVGDTGAEEVTQTNLRHPRPRPRLNASFLKEFVDPIGPYPGLGSIHTFVSKWLESVGSDRGKHCLSDSHLHLSNHGPVSRRLTRSAPEMSSTRGADGFVVPAVPASSRSRISRIDSGDDFNRSLASSTGNPRHPRYRETSLLLNHIYIRHPATPLPDLVTGCIDSIRAQRDSPGLSPDELSQAIYQLDTLEEGCDEDQVAGLLNNTAFPNTTTDTMYGPGTGLTSNSGTLIAQHLVPITPTSPYRVSQPKPDKLYGYSGRMTGAFTEPQLLAKTMLHPKHPDYATATSKALDFPFFVVEFKAAGGTRGDLWVATNQCAGASAACLNVVSQLNWALQKYQSTERIDNLCYSVAVDNNLAKLYISWKEDDRSYYFQRIGTFLLSHPEGFKDFRKQVRNILDWGKGARLTQIRDALDIVLEGNRKCASEAARSRPSPS